MKLLQIFLFLKNFDNKWQLKSNTEIKNNDLNYNRTAKAETCLDECFCKCIIKEL